MNRLYVSCSLIIMECRFCLSDETPETLIAPCQCRGTLTYVHDSCLRTYFVYFPDRICRVCHERMEHPWIDLERNVICATITFLWIGILSALSSASLSVKVACVLGSSALLAYHVWTRRLSYEFVIVGVATSATLTFTDPAYLPQTVILVSAILLLVALCCVVPAEALLIIMVFGLAVLYSLLAILAVAIRTDPAFSGLFLLTLATFWFAIVRPGYRNDIYRWDNGRRR